MDQEVEPFVTRMLPDDLVHVIDVTVSAEADGDPFCKEFSDWRDASTDFAVRQRHMADTGSSCANDVEFRIGHLHALASEK